MALLPPVAHSGTRRDQVKSNSIQTGSRPSAGRKSGERESDRAPEGPDPLIGQLIADKFGEGE